MSARRLMIKFDETLAMLTSEFAECYVFAALLACCPMSQHSRLAAREQAPGSQFGHGLSPYESALEIGCP